MNKRFLLVAALCAAMNLGAFAQTNLAEGKTATASTEQDAFTANLAVDGETNTRWSADNNTEKDINDADSYSYYVDLGEEKDFNVIQIVWQTAYGKAFKIYTANEIDATTSQPKWGENAAFTQESTIIDDAEGKEVTYKVGDLKARYVKFKATELGMSPWLSFYEFRVMKMELQAILKNLTVSKEIVKVGDTFTINTLDQFGEQVSDAEISVTNAEKQADGSYKATAAGDIVITAKAGDVTLTKTIQAYTPELTTVSVSPAFVLTNQETELAFTAKDQQGDVITDFTTSLTDNKLTATEDGKQEITVSWNGTEKKVVVYAISKAAEVPTLGDTELSIYGDDTTGLEISNSGWNGQYDKQQQLDLNGNKVFMVTNVGTFGIKKEDIENDEYTSLNFDIFPTTDVTGYVQIEGSNLDNLPIRLKAGEWNHVSLDITGAKALNSYIQIYVGAAGADNNPDILLDNVYLSKKAAEVKEEVIISKTADEKGFYAVTGYAKSADIINNALTDKNVTAWDLTELKTEGSYTITPANTNAIVKVAGTETDGTATPAADWGETKNLVVGQNYLFPVKQLEFTDSNDPMYTAFFVSTANTGWKYTRQLPANTWVTTVLPANAEIPAGCKVYEITENTEAANSLLLKETTELNGKTPYIIYNGNDSEATLTVSGTGDFDLRSDVEKTVGDVTVHGTFKNINGDGTMYGLKGQTGTTEDLKLQKIGENASTSAFRLYFTATNATADIANYSISFPGDTTTGIGSVNVETSAKKANGVYTLDGRKVSEGSSLNGLAKGIYIVNGKKVVK